MASHFITNTIMERFKERVPYPGVHCSFKVVGDRSRENVCNWTVEDFPILTDDRHGWLTPAAQEVVKRIATEVLGEVSQEYDLESESP